VNEDFDQALGYYGIPTGPYVVLPFLVLRRLVIL
jgi:ABC-type transporter lipoprotein component MlaA